MTPPPDRPHTPVMLQEVLDVLNPRDGAIYVDGTFGAGGYTTAILETADCRVFGIDRDPRALAVGEELACRFPGRLRVLGGCYGDMVRLLGEAGIDRIDGPGLVDKMAGQAKSDQVRGVSFSYDLGHVLGPDPDILGSDLRALFCGPNMIWLVH